MQYFFEEDLRPFELVKPSIISRLRGKINDYNLSHNLKQASKPDMLDDSVGEPSRKMEEPSMIVLNKGVKKITADRPVSGIENPVTKLIKKGITSATER